VTELTTAQIEKLLAFRGYGNPNGRFWFVGMEEGGGDIESLRIRADKFSNLEDLAESYQRFESHDMSNLISTWRIMSAIAGRIGGITDWWDPEYARNYQLNHLGRTNGETYLTEILPLPKRSLNDCPIVIFLTHLKTISNRYIPLNLILFGPNTQKRILNSNSFSATEKSTGNTIVKYSTSLHFNPHWTAKFNGDATNLQFSSSPIFSVMGGQVLAKTS
jgi:hypothetical protein